jgi:hypothetical protein
MDFSRDQKAELLPCPVEKSAIVHNRYESARTAHQKAIILGIFSTKDTRLYLRAFCGSEPAREGDSRRKEEPEPAQVRLISTDHYQEQPA